VTAPENEYHQQRLRHYVCSFSISQENSPQNDFIQKLHQKAGFFGNLS
jgi:hypothetical protein